MDVLGKPVGISGDQRMPMGLHMATLCEPTGTP